MTRLYIANSGDIGSRDRADKIAADFGFELSYDRLPDSDAYFLQFDGNTLGLTQGNSPKTRVVVDFCSGAVAHRRRFGGGKGQDIAKAVGISASYCPTVVDATAGLGRDAFVLATLGCDVVAVERQPVVAALLQDGLARAENHPDINDIMQRIRMVHSSSHHWLSEQPENSVDVVYLDPMFDHDPKQKAAVKKDMQAFRTIVGHDADCDDLLSPALHAARCRVVVKRARKAVPMAGKAPSYSITGKSNRFDVYAMARVAPAGAQ